MLVWCILSRRAVPISSHNNPHPSHPNDRHPNFVAGCIQQRRAISHISKFKSILCVLPREVQTCTNIAGCEDSILPVPNPFSVGTRDCLSVFFHSWVIEVFVWVVWYPVISHHWRGSRSMPLTWRICFWRHSKHKAAECSLSAESQLLDAWVPHSTDAER